MKILFTCTEVHRGVDWQTAVLRGDPLGENIAASTLQVPVTKDWFDSFVEGGVYEVSIEEKQRPTGGRIQFVASAVGHVENPKEQDEHAGIQEGPAADEPQGTGERGESASEAPAARPRSQPPPENPPTKGHKKPAQVLKKR